MNILCATDDKYVPYCGVMLTSLFESNPKEHFNVFILVESLGNTGRKQFEMLAKKYGQSIHIREVKSEVFSNCPINPETDHVSLAAYFRLAVTEILPKNVDRVLYLDCDIIVQSSIRSFYDIDLDGRACAIVQDEAAHIDEPYYRFGLPRNHEPLYINSGVLLIDLEYWRKHLLFESFFKYIKENKSLIKFHDQDTIYGVLRNEVKYADVKYNLQRGFLYKKNFEAYTEQLKQEIRLAIDAPVIIHYTGAIKPWMMYDKNPFAKIWREFHTKSLWKDAGLIHTRFSVKKLLTDIAKQTIWLLGIKKRPQTYINGLPKA